MITTATVNVINKTNKIPNKTPLTVDFFLKEKYKALNPTTGAVITPTIHTTMLTIGIKTVGIITIIAWAGLTDMVKKISDNIIVDRNNTIFLVYIKYEK